jgi:uncharacterized membrane protein YraQ (UPF0718 family)
MIIYLKYVDTTHEKENVMSYIIQLLETALDKVMLAFAHNWIYLLASVLVGSLIKLFLDKDRVAAYLRQHQNGGVALSTAVAVGTPLCSCGTTAIVIGMMASMMPWAPIVAFMVSSPLSSPEGMFYTAGLFGWPFALAGFIASILLGLAGGLVAGVLERRGWLKNQARLVSARPASAATPSRVFPIQSTCGCQPDQLLPVAAQANLAACVCRSVPLAVAIPSPSSCGSQANQSLRPGTRPRVTLQLFGQQITQDAPRLLVMFFSFAFLGYLLNGLIPNTWITGLFGNGHAYSVPLAATFGLPFYINSEASLPMVRAMLDSGMSQGAALAFLISGAGTSIGAIGGALSIARWRVIALVVGTLWIGAMAVGLLFDLFLASGLI